jgi:hypothetical protein
MNDPCDARKIWYKPLEKLRQLAGRVSVSWWRPEYGTGIAELLNVWSWYDGFMYM